MARRNKMVDHLLVVRVKEEFGKETLISESSRVQAGDTFWGKISRSRQDCSQIYLESQKN